MTAFHFWMNNIFQCHYDYGLTLTIKNLQENKANSSNLVKMYHYSIMYYELHNTLQNLLGSVMNISYVLCWHKVGYEIDVIYDECVWYTL